MRIFSGLFCRDEVVLGLKLCGAAGGLSLLRVTALGSPCLRPGLDPQTLQSLSAL